MSFPLAPTEQPYCQGHWDPVKKKYTDDNSLDVVMCCINSCKDYVADCFNSCHSTYGPKSLTASYKNHKKCHQQCEELIHNCESVCLSYPMEGMKAVSECAKEKKCGYYPLFDQTCLLENNDDIMECCRKSCTYGNCDRECKQTLRHLTYGTDSPLSSIANQFVLSRSQFDQVEPNDSYLYVVYFLVAIVFFLGVYILGN